MTDREPSPPPVDARFSLANERTYLAWVRTGLSLMAAGGASLAFLADGLGRARLLVALPLIAAGALVALRAHARLGHVQAAMERGEPLPPPPLARPLALLVCATGLLLAVLAVLDVL